MSDHFDGVRFFNPGQAGPGDGWLSCAGSSPSAARRGRRASPARLPPDRPPARFDGDAVRVTHVGHASFLMQTRGSNILIDPVWAERASPFSFLGPKRVNAPGIAFDDLPKIDAVLVTHNHYDHMDVGTIGRLWQRFRPRIVTPLGNDTILKGAVPGLVAERRRLGRGGRPRRRPYRARRADAALVGARHRRSQSRAVGELRRAGGRARRSTASATAASAPAPRSRACASAIRSWRSRCCRSAPTSRAGSCATPT